MYPPTRFTGRGIAVIGKDNSMERYREDMLRDICRLVEIPSVLEEGGSLPFGENVDRCLDAALEMMARLGFRTKKAEDGKYGWAEIGDGPLFGVVCHLDVVPAREADGWEHDPFRPEIRDGYLCGRGVQDDKGPTVAAVYALKSLLDEGRALKKRVRFLFGTDEENLWRGIKAYAEREELPAEGFAPDSAFPLTYAEKGLLQVILRSKDPAPVTCSGGDSFNAVSGHALCPAVPGLEDALSARGYAYHVDGDLLTVEGVTAHAKNPWKGVSANLRLLRALSDAGYSCPAIRFACDTLDGKFRFEGFTDEDLSDFSGPVTVNLGKMALGSSGTEFCLDLRLPSTCEKEKILSLLREKAAVYGMTVEEYDWLRPIFVPLESELVQNLLNAYREVTGDMETAPYISAGATYARAFDHFVAFGANLPGNPTSEHQPNERVKLDSLLTAAKVYRRAFEKCVIA